METTPFLSLYDKVATSVLQEEYRDQLMHFCRASPALALLPVLDLPPLAALERPEDFGRLWYNIRDAKTALPLMDFDGGLERDFHMFCPPSELARPYGGNLDVDMALIKMRGPEVRESHVKLKMKMLALGLTEEYLKVVRQRLGKRQMVRSEPDPQFFDPHSIRALFDRCPEATHIVMDLKLRRDLTRWWRSLDYASQSPGYEVDWSSNDAIMGRHMRLRFDIGKSYPAEVPVLDAGYSVVGERLLARGEAFAFAFKAGYACAAQVGPISIEDQGELYAQPVVRMVFEWIVTPAFFHGQSVAHLSPA